MHDDDELRIDLEHVRREGPRLNRLGALRITFIDPSDLEDLHKVRSARCVGFAVDAFSRECLLWNCLEPRGGTWGPFVLRCIPATNIEKMERISMPQPYEGPVIGDPRMN